ncbi:hypothetical protein [Phenylobacterium soli]|uniref:HTH iclR-type domain-containing protein n=1 Tax=Phenylobacterium soli TaxID=2170551 RepID=A0A328AHE1_9CAUL|nr:hypothetical protein [Phenylobacterium soli]RAK53937.1 hypothetical protein DJ017_05075 [Phenylobacterium soli]
MALDELLHRSAAFVTDAANISRGDGDLLEPLVFAAIVQANIAPSRNQPERKRLDAAGEALPDEIRRPISIYAVANSLALPYETVRRRVLALVEAGRCVLTPDGAYVPREVIVSPAHMSIQAARLQRLQRFHDELVGIGVLQAGESLPGPLPSSHMRPVNTVLSEFMLRTADRMVALTGELMSGLVLLAMWSTGPGAPPCPSLRLSTQLGMPRERVRRRLMELGRMGFVRQLKEGWVTQTPSAQRQALEALAAANEAEVRRLFARLRDIAARPAA